MFNFATNYYLCTCLVRDIYMKKIVLLFLVLCCEATGYSMDIESTMPSDTLYVASADIDDVATTDTAVSETPKKKSFFNKVIDYLRKNS